MPVWVLGRGLTGSELAVYVALRSFADGSGSAPVQVRTIADRARVSERTTERAIARLRDLDMLTTSQAYRGDGSIWGCTYTLRDVPPAAVTA